MASSETRTAAVLVPVFRDAAGILRLLLVVREDRGIHGRQLGFPGGYREPEDATLRETALREAEEEIGLARAEVELLCELEHVHTRASETWVAPFLGRVGGTRAFVPRTGEVTGLVTPAVSLLADPGARARLPFSSAAIPEELIVDGVDVDGHVLWGLSLRIVDGLLPRLAAGEWEV